MRRLLIFSVAAITLGGCMVGPDYQRPQIDTPQSYRYEPDEARDAANLAWWKQFNDPVLDQLITEALAANWDVKIAAARVQKAAGVLQTTRSALFPQLDYSGEGARQRISENNISVPLKNPYSSFEVLGQASWSIDLWGRIRRLSESAQASLLASEEARQGIILSLVSEVASSYIQLRAFDEQLVIANRTAKAYDQALKLFELQFRHGQVDQMIVEQARSQYETAAAIIPQIQNQIVQTENALSILLGRNPGPISRGKAIGTLAAPVIPAGLPSELLQRRPDIRQAEENLIAANALIGAAKALYFPTISLTGSFGTASIELDDLFRGPSHMWNFAGSVTGPIFTAGAIAGQVKQAEADQQAALFAYRQAIQNAFADVENSLVSHQKLFEQLASQQRQVASLTEYSRLAWLQYNGGYTPYLTVLDADQQRFQAELNETQTHAAALISLVEIYRAMGGGWIVEAEKMTAPAAPRSETHKNKLQNQNKTESD